SQWITQDFPKSVEDAITSPTLPAMFDMIYAIDADMDLTRELGGLRDELLAEDEGFQDLLVVAGDTLEAAKDASLAVGIVKYMGRELDPGKKLLFNLAELTQKSLALDTDEHVLVVVHRGLDEAPDGDLYASGITHAIRQANRINPL